MSVITMLGKYLNGEDKDVIFNKINNVRNEYEFDIIDRPTYNNALQYLLSLGVILDENNEISLTDKGKLLVPKQV